MTNTTKIGDDFRDRVFGLVSAAKKYNAEREKKILGKKADIYFEDQHTYGGNIRLAIECKYYESPFDRSLYNKIFKDYDPVKEGFDYLIVITKKPAASDVLISLESTKWMKHNTFEQFAASLMDFDAYLRSLRAMFDNEGLSSYYIPIKDEDGNDIDPQIVEWIESDDSQPQALLAGYGMGKTSFALQLASKYALSDKNEPFRRIPIYLKLGGIYNEQSLEGLICKYFSSDYHAPGFTYPLFMKLNEQGRFLVILDGFDEMKHAMNITDFLSNFEEFNKLAVPNSKVVLLGRPNAFTSEDEHNSVLHGFDKLGDKNIRRADRCDYKETKIGLFDEVQVKDFVRQYLQYKSKEMAGSSYAHITSEFIELRINEIVSPVYGDLIARPVHARMLCLIALSTDELLSSFSRFDLYKKFINRIYERERSKESRKKVSELVRFSFIKKVAWHQWVKNGKNSFAYKDIESINFTDLPDEAPHQDILRELVIGSVLERKGEGYFYFSHRSFQEYLVSEYIIDTTWSTNDIPHLSKAFNNEISEFIIESKNHCNIAEEILNLLSPYTGEISKDLFEFLRKSLGELIEYDLKLEEEELSPWRVLVLFNTNTSNFPLIPPENLRLYDSIRNPYTKMALILSMTLRSLELEYAFGLLVRECMPIIQKFHFHNGKIQGSTTIEDAVDQAWIDILLTAVDVEFNKNNELKNITLKTKEFAAKITENSAHQFSVLGLLDDHIFTNMNVNILSLNPYLNYSGRGNKNNHQTEEVRALRLKFIDFWRSKPNKSMFVHVTNKCDEHKDKRSTLTLKPNGKLKVKSRGTH